MRTAKSSFDSYVLGLLLFFVLIVLSIPAIAYLQEVQVSNEKIITNDMVQVIQPSVATSLGEDVVETETNIGISDRSDERIVKALMSEKILNELKQAKNKDSDPSRIIEERVKTIYRQGVSFE